MSLGNYLASKTFGGITRTFNRAVPYFFALRRLLFYAGGAYATGVLFRHHVYDWSSSIGPSMYPTVPAENSVAFNRKLSKKALAASTLGGGVREEHRVLRVGDMIQFQAPIFSEQYAGKRIVGMPGDYVVKDPSYAASVGGATVSGITDWRSDQEIEQGIELKEREEPEMIRVPEGHVWVTGDNMSWSRDSRFYGPVPMALISGRTDFGLEGFFSGKSYRGAMRRIPKEEEEWVLNGRAAKFAEDQEGIRKSANIDNDNK